MRTKYSADDMPSIAQRLKEIEAEKMAAIMGKPLEDPRPVEAPADIDWNSVYGLPMGYALKEGDLHPRYFDLNTIRGPLELKSLAHPEWPYAGTGHEWRVRIK